MDRWEGACEEKGGGDAQETKNEKLCIKAMDQ